MTLQSNPETLLKQMLCKHLLISVCQTNHPRQITHPQSRSIYNNRQPFVSSFKFIWFSPIWKDIPLSRIFLWLTLFFEHHFRLTFHIFFFSPFFQFWLSSLSLSVFHVSRIMKTCINVIYFFHNFLYILSFSQSFAQHTHTNTLTRTVYTLLLLRLFAMTKYVCSQDGGNENWCRWTCGMREYYISSHQYYICKSFTNEICIRCAQFLPIQLIAIISFVEATTTNILVYIYNMCITHSNYMAGIDTRIYLCIAYTRTRPGEGEFGARNFPLWAHPCLICLWWEANKNKNVIEVWIFEQVPNWISIPYLVGDSATLLCRDYVHWHLMIVVCFLFVSSFFGFGNVRMQSTTDTIDVRILFPRFFLYFFSFFRVFFFLVLFSMFNAEVL